MKDIERTHKTCSACGREKPVSEFYRNQDHWTSRCKSCLLAIRARDWRANPGKAKAQSKAKYWQNREANLAANAAWREQQKAQRVPKTEEEKRAVRAAAAEKKRAWWQNLSVEEKTRRAANVSQAQKRRWATMPDADRAAFLKKRGDGRRREWATVPLEIRKQRLANASTPEVQRRAASTNGRRNRASTIEVMVRTVLDVLDIQYDTQHWIGPYAVDFYIPDRNLIIEADGDYWHSRPAQIEHDRRRDAYLAERGYRVVRLWETAIRADALTSVQQALAS